MTTYTEIESDYRYSYLVNLPQEQVPEDHPLWTDGVSEVARVTEGDEDVPTGTLIVYDDNGPWARLFTADVSHGVGLADAGVWDEERSAWSAREISLEPEPTGERG